MPIFEYSCIKCGHHFEKLQKDGTTQPAECPSCGAAEIRRELSVFSSTGSPAPASGCFSGG